MIITYCRVAAHTSAVAPTSLDTLGRRFVALPRSHGTDLDILFHKRHYKVPTKSKWRPGSRRAVQYGASLGRRQLVRQRELLMVRALQIPNKHVSILVFAISKRTLGQVLLDTGYVGS